MGKRIINTIAIVGITVVCTMAYNISELIAQEEPPNINFQDIKRPEKATKVIPKLETPLSELYIHRDQPSKMSPQYLNQVEKYLVNGNVQVVVVLNNINGVTDVKNHLELIGASIVAEFETRIEVIVPTTALKALSEIEEVLYIRRPIPLRPIESTPQINLNNQSSEPVIEPLASTGTYVTQGVAASNADKWHTNFTGSGINVAIFDKFQNWSFAQAAGDLPPTLYTYGTVDFNSPHGTAVAEIIYDMAPGATLTFVSPSSDVQMASYIVDLAQAGCDIISSSIGYVFLDPGDGSGTISSAINTAVNTYGTLVSQSAGNYAEFHWDGNYNDTNNDNLHEFSGDPLNLLGVLPAGYPIDIRLRWNDWPVSDQDYDLHLYYYDGVDWYLAASSINSQTGTQPPIEAIIESAPLTGIYGYTIEKYDATGNHVLDVMALDAPSLTHNVQSRSLIDTATALKTFSVAAVDVSTYNLESYSSHGPAHGLGGILSGGIAQPRIAGFANVDTYSYGAGVFNGTSAAQPHVAGAAAIVRQAYPSYSPDQVMQWLENRAIDQGATGYDYLYGAGRLSLGPAPFSVTVSKDGTGTGIITSNPTGISCGSDCGEFYWEGNSVTLTATASSDSTVSWSNCTSQGGTVGGDDTSVATCTFSSLAANKTVTATFTYRTYTLTPNAGSNGSINPATSQTVVRNTTTSVTATSDPNYHVASISGCGINYVNTSNAVTNKTETSGAITADCTVTATFAINQYSVSASAGTNGSLDAGTPSPATVGHGLTTAFTFNADPNYHIASVSGCDGAPYNNSSNAVTSYSYTTGSITSDCTVTASFAINTFTITPNPGANGSMDPPAPQVVDYNSTQAFTVTSDSGYRIDSVTGCGGNLDGNIFTTASITSDCTVTATFSPGGYIVTPISGANGSISPSTPQEISHGLTTAFTITPEASYHIDSVSGCGGSLAGDTYTTAPIYADCSVTANFAIDTHLLSVTVRGKGKGTVTSNPGTINCQETGSELFDHGTIVTLMATPEGSSTFIGWSGDCTGTDLTCDVTIDQARSVTAEFYGFPWNLFLPAIMMK